MEVIQYLKEHGLAKLVEEFAIKIKEYDEGLIVLNYDQIDSPKTHPIVMECRSLILDKQFNVVSRSFDRFFNLGEQPETQAQIDMSKASCFDKVDGSLIKIYNYKGTWHAATRGTAYAESQVNGFDLTFKDLVLKALRIPDDAHFQAQCNQYLFKDVTYIFEITSAENRVVKSYSGYTLHYLAARNNKTFEYADYTEDAVALGAKAVREYKFNSVEDCVDVAKHLKDLDEGYVLYQDGRPVCKIKSPTYVAVHLIRGEGLNPKRIMQLVLSGEQEEYLTYFNEDRSFFKPYEEALETLKDKIEYVWFDVFQIESQKDFAIAIKDYPFSAVLFQTRKNGKTPQETFNEQTEMHKIRMLEEWMA